LASVTTQTSGGAITQAVEHTYDAFNRRIAKSVDPDGAGSAAAEVERFVYDGDRIALVFDGEGYMTTMCA
jgi:hypothetical protein